MCEMLNLFVPSRHPTRCPPVRGLEFVEDGEVQRDFKARYAGRGTILAGVTSGPCLCGFDDWAALWEQVQAQLAADQVDEVAVLRFWSGDRYQLTEVVVDPDDDPASTELALGVVALAQVVRPEARRHRQVVRALIEHLGAAVVLRRKSGAPIHGVLRAFDPASEVGDVDGVFFVAAQLLAVEPAAS